MDELNSSLATPLQTPIENTQAGNPASKLLYIIIGILVIILGVSLFFLNTIYHKAQTLGVELIKLSEDITTKDTLITSLNTSITNLNIEIKAIKDTTASGTAHTTNNADTSSGLESYLKEARDTARRSHIMELVRALGTYYADKESYPMIPKSGCIPSDELSGAYMPKIPVDPIAERHSSGCDNSDNMTYAYRTLNSNDGYARVILASDLETEAGGNSDRSIDEIMALEDPIKYVDENLKPGVGKYYIITY